MLNISLYLNLLQSNTTLPRICPDNMIIESHLEQVLKNKSFAGEDIGVIYLLRLQKSCHLSLSHRGVASVLTEPGSHLASLRLIRNLERLYSNM